MFNMCEVRFTPLKRCLRWASVCFGSGTATPRRKGWVAWGGVLKVFVGLVFVRFTHLFTLLRLKVELQVQIVQTILYCFYW